MNIESTCFNLGGDELALILAYGMQIKLKVGNAIIAHTSSTLIHRGCIGYSLEVIDLWVAVCC
jgi:hypothetical protein